MVALAKTSYDKNSTSLSVRSCVGIRAEYGLVANIDNNVLISVRGRCIGYREHCRKVIFYHQPTFHVLQRKKINVKIWRLEKEKLFLDCIQRTNTGDGGRVGISAFGTATTKICTENKDNEFYCDIVQHQLKPSMAQMTKKIKFFFSRRVSSLTHIKYRQRKNR